jgi:hypothetical protein
VTAVVVVMRSGDWSRCNVCFLDIGMATTGFWGGEETHLDFV